MNSRASPLSVIISTSLAVLIGLVFSSPAVANPELAKAKNCASCHNVDKGVLGPSYKQVAEKYANDKNAVSKLTEKVLAGGSGVWGRASMPANPQVTKEEAETLVKWILTLK